MNEWISIKDGLPADGDQVLVSNIETGEVDMARFNRTYFDNDSGVYMLEVTHWMPLPSPPEGEDK